MAPTKKPQKATKREKLFHPESRKAGQVARKQLRKSKLAGQASKRVKLHSSKGKSSEPFIHSFNSQPLRQTKPNA
jgi:translation machinery-associated protein 16